VGGAGQVREDESSVLIGCSGMHVIADVTDARLQLQHLPRRLL